MSPAKLKWTRGHFRKLLVRSDVRVEKSQEMIPENSFPRNSVKTSLPREGSTLNTVKVVARPAQIQRFFRFPYCVFRRNEHVPHFESRWSIRHRVISSNH